MSYPYLDPAYKHLVKIAKLYDIDLSKANESERVTRKYGSRFGAQEGDINLDIAGAIHQFTIEMKTGIYPNAMRNFIIVKLLDWGYENDEITKAMLKIPKLSGGDSIENV